MKTSNKIILFTGAIPFIIALIMILSLRNTLSGETDPALLNQEQVNTEKFSFDYKDFENISAKGVWDINLVNGDHFNVELEVAESLLNEISVNQSGRTLVLLSKKNRYTLFSIGSIPKINITLPLLSELDLEGVANISLSEFKNRKTSVDINGLANLKGKNSVIDNFYLKSDGMLNISMDDISVTNAYINHNGIYNIDMHMNGGKLSGRLDGIGKMNVSGTVGENSIKVDGLGNLTID